MTTTSTSLGYEFGYDYVTNGWNDYVNCGEYTTEQQSAIVYALTHAQVEEFEALLPESHYWLIHTSELQYPVGDDTDLGDLEELLGQSAEAVSARFPQIEAEALIDHS